jgi:hypothetical protein
VDKLTTARAFLGNRYCLAAPVIRFDLRPWPEPPPVPGHLLERQYKNERQSTEIPV